LYIMTSGDALDLKVISMVVFLSILG
jgi:hypothetical protein